MHEEDALSCSMIRCEACDTAIPAFDIVSYGSIEHGYRQLCSQCFNAEVASAQGLEHFENYRFHPVVMTDCTGQAHEFQFRTRLLGPMVSLEAFELKRGEPAGYQFQILGEPDDDLLSLLGRLVERMRRSCRSSILCRARMDCRLPSRPCARESTGTKRRMGASPCWL